MAEAPAPVPLDALGTLAAALQSLGVKQCASVADLLELPVEPPSARSAVTAGLVVRPSIRVQQHHDLEPAMLMYDPYLGTIGLVEVIDSADRTTVAIEQAVDRAAYLRQLCLFQAQGDRKLPLTVDVILLFPKAPATESGAAVADFLQGLAKNTGYLRTVGVSLLYEQLSGGFAPHDLRRAFPWLLAATRKWFPDPKQTGAPSPASGPWSITLTNYRHPGDRKFQFEGGAIFHVLHGYNGSGKSTFTEAIELLLTDSIERLDQARVTDYYPIVRFHDKQVPQAAPAADNLPVQIQLQLQPGTPEIMVTLGPGARPVRTGLASDALLGAAPSFRLDQGMMDSLVRSSEAERAALFLRAFFPSDRPIFQEMDTAASTAAGALAKLPPALRDAAPADPAERIKFLEEKLAWIDQPPSAWTVGILPTLEPLLPFTVRQLQLLSQANPTLLSTVDRFSKEAGNFHLETDLQKLDDAIENVRPQIATVRQSLEMARKVFEDFGKWQASGRIQSESDFQKVLDRWLELQALCDLVGKYYEVTATLAQARNAGWKPAAEHESLFDKVTEPPERVESLRVARQELAAARDLARGAVRDWGGQSTTTGAGQSGAGVRPPRLHLTDTEKAALDQAGNLLPSLATESGGPTLSALFLEALASDNIRTRGSATIGSPGGLSIPVGEIDEILEALKRLEALPPDRTGGVSEAFKNAKSALAEHRNWKKHEEAVKQSFFSQITRKDGAEHPLNAAVNELLALFKPAPWAYQDIALRAGHRGAGAATEELGIRTIDQSRAELRLNTAEMNSFTVTLFLLCAPKLENPLKLLLLDDPLQNMDEMTVGAMARGLAKLMRIFPPGWRIVSLFHGEEDLYRIREELPSAVYRLPWLTPNGRSDERTIVREPDSTDGRPFQQLKDLLPPPVVAGSKDGPLPGAPPTRK